ncbi:LysR substrate-binding domain-containing protein [Sneathiella sp.]|jgi:LysR family glycine cleavage system transcriptional activator|uniref:LysR substrate-binding domain-containing protein n=1 Tax=Sneathiella sp. TaxID=1964365 RepID=UPI0039E640F2
MLTIPSISGLRAFEASCRYLSFNQAAEELNVTPGAVSRQIHSLEQFLGKTLFHRHHKRIELTAVGRQYLAEINLPLEKISAATNRLRSEPRRNVISICAYPTFAIRWLIPRWAALYDAFPDLDIQLTTSLNPADFDEQNFDISIDVMTMGSSRKGCQIDKLLDVETYPVCSPELAKEITCFDDLNKVTLLHESPRPTDWQRWAAAANISSLDTSRGMNFESANMALHAAIEGLGVVIGIDALVQEDIKKGRLVKLFSVTRVSHFPFQLVTQNRTVMHPKLQAVRQWLLEQAGVKN